MSLERSVTIENTGGRRTRACKRVAYSAQFSPERATRTANGDDRKEKRASLALCGVDLQKTNHYDPNYNHDAEKVISTRGSGTRQSSSIYQTINAMWHRRLTRVWAGVRERVR